VEIGTGNSSAAFGKPFACLRRADLHQAIASNSFITLHGGDRELEFRGTDDNGQVETASAKITVE